MPTRPAELRPTLVLDTGAVLALARGDVRLRARIRAAVLDGAGVVVPPAVVTQSVRGGPRDAPVNQLLKRVLVPPVELSLARLAGILLGRSGSTDVADAQIAAEAMHSGPCVLLTGDPYDMLALLGDAPGVVVTSA